MKLRCISGEPAAFREAYRRLWRKHKKGFGTFSCLDSFQDRLCQGNFLVLRKRFRLTTLILLREEEPVLMATLFEAAPGWPSTGYPSSIGAVCACPGLRPEEAAFFWEWVSRDFGHLKPVGPLNGHNYLGFNLAPFDADPARVGFQTAAPHPIHSRIFAGFDDRRVYRRSFSFETFLDAEALERLKAEISTVPPGFRVRKFRPWAARRDFALMNELVNQSFGSHFDFAPLSEEENWDIFRFSLPVLRPSHLLFLEHDGRPVAFCLGFRDYNRVLGNVSDLENYGRLLLSPKPLRARLVHIGILPEYRGRKLVKQIRHRLLLNFASEGIREVENSFIDEGNANSMGNVKSTGARPLYEFRTFALFD